MTRRHFLQTAASTILSMGFGGLFSSPGAEAHTHDVRHLRQIVTRDPGRTHMIQWDSPRLLTSARVEVRRTGAHAQTDIYFPAYTYFAMDGSVQ